MWQFASTWRQSSISLTSSSASRHSDQLECWSSVRTISAERGKSIVTLPKIVIKCSLEYPLTSHANWLTLFASNVTPTSLRRRVVKSSSGYYRQTCKLTIPTPRKCKTFWKWQICESTSRDFTLSATIFWTIVLRSGKSTITPFKTWWFAALARVTDTLPSACHCLVCWTKRTWFTAGASARTTPRVSIARTAKTFTTTCRGNQPLESKPTPARCAIATSTPRLVTLTKRFTRNLEGCLVACAMIASTTLLARIASSANPSSTTTQQRTSPILRLASVSCCLVYKSLDYYIMKQKSNNNVIFFFSLRLRSKRFSGRWNLRFTHRHSQWRWGRTVPLQSQHRGPQMRSLQERFLELWSWESRGLSKLHVQHLGYHWQSGMQHAHGRVYLQTIRHVKGLQSMFAKLLGIVRRQRRLQVLRLRSWRFLRGVVRRDNWPMPLQASRLWANL